MLFCAVIIRISVRFCIVRTPLTPLHKVLKNLGGVICYVVQPCSSLISPDTAIFANSQLLLITQKNTGFFRYCTWPTNFNQSKLLLLLAVQNLDKLINLLLGYIISYRSQNFSYFSVMFTAHEVLFVHVNEPQFVVCQSCTGKCWKNISTWSGCHECQWPH